MPVDTSTYQKYYNALQQAYGKDGTVEKGAFNLGYDDFRTKLQNQDYAQKIYGALDQAYGKQGVAEKGAFTLPFNDFYSKITSTGKQQPTSQPINVSPPPSIKDVFSYHPTDQNFTPALMPKVNNVSVMQQHADEVQTAANDVTKMFNDNKDQAIHKLLLDDIKQQQARLNNAYQDGQMDDKTFQKGQQQLFNRMLNPANDVAQFKQDMQSDGSQGISKKARQVVDAIAKLNPDKAAKIKSDMYLLDSQNRPDKSNLILQNARSIKNGSGIDYDVKKGLLSKNEGFFESLGQGLSERNRMMKDYDFYNNETPENIVSRLESQRASFDPDLPVNTPYGIGGHLGQAIGGQGIVTAKAMVAGGATSLIPVVGEAAAPWVAAAASSPEFYKLGYVSSLENEYHQLRNAGVEPTEALKRAQDKASFDAKVDVAQGALSTVIGTRMGIKPGEFSPTFENSIKNIAVHSGKWLGETSVEGGANALLAGGLQELKNIHAGRPAEEGAFETGMGQMMFAYGLGALTKTGRALLNPKSYRSILQTMSRAPESEVNTALASMVSDGSISHEDALDIHNTVNQQRLADSKIPETVTNDNDRAKIQDMISQRDALDTKMEGLDKAYHPEIKDQIKDLNEKIASATKNPSEPSTKPSTEPTFKSEEDQQRVHDNEISSQLKPASNGEETQGNAQAQEIEKPAGSEGAISAEPAYLLSRHADTIKDEQDKVSGPNQHPLSVKGKRDANDLAKEVQEHAEQTGVPVTKIVHSALERAKETGDKVSEKTGAKTISDSGLNTWDIKDFDDVSDDEFKNVQKWFAEHPDEKVYNGPIEKFKGKSLGESLNQYAHRTIAAHEPYQNEPASTLLIDHSNNMMVMDAYRKNGNQWNEQAIKDYLNAEKPEPATLVKKNNVSYSKITNVKLKDNALLQSGPKALHGSEQGQNAISGSEHARVGASQQGNEPAGESGGQSAGQPTEQPVAQEEKGTNEKADVPPVHDEDWPFVEEPEDNEVTSLKNAVTAQKVEDAGLMPAMKEAKREFGQVWEEAQKKLAKGYDIEGLIDSLKKKPRPITDLENAMILYHQNVKESQLAQANKELDEARASNDRPAWNEAYNTRAKLLDDLQKLYDVDKAVGTANARGLNARKMMADRRFSLVNMQAEKRAANGGEPLTDKQLEEVKQQYEEIKKAKDAYEARIKNLEKENEELKQQKPGKSVKLQGKQLADRIRSLKINKGDKAQANILSLPVAVYDGAISTIALAIENGAKLVEAIQKGVDYIKAKHGFEGPEDEKKFRDQFSDIDNPEKTIAERYQEAKEAVKKRIDSLRDQIVKGEERLKVEKKPLSGDVELNRLREEEKTLNSLLDKYKPVFDKYADQRQLTQSKKRLTNEINDLNTQINNRERSKPEEKKEITDNELESMKSIRDAKKAILDQLVPIEKKARIPKTDAERLVTYKKNTIKSTQEVEAKTRAGDFSKKAPKPLILDREALRLKGEYDKAKDKFELGLKKDELARRSGFQKGLDAFVKWSRAFKLSNPVTLAKLTQAAITRLVQTPVEEVVGGVYSTALPTIARKAEGEGGFNVKALAKAYKSAITQGMKDAYQTIKSKGTGKSDLDYQIGGKSHLPPEAIDFLGQLHGAIKAPVKRFAFERSLEKRLSRNIANGVDVTDPEVQTRILTDSYKDAQRAIFMQDNFVSKQWQNFVGSLERGAANKKNNQLERGLSKAGAATANFLVPFVKVPTNIVGEVGTHTLGLPIAGAKILHTVFTKGLSELSSNEADFILRNMKKGTLGAGALLLGYFRPDLFGGYYQRGEKRKEGDLKAGEMNVGGFHIPVWLLESPIFQTMQVGATIRKAKDKLVKDEPQGIGEGIWAGALGLAQHEPLIDQPARISNMLNSNNERNYYLDELAKSTIDPAILDFAAKATDPEKTRKPKTLLEHIETGIPGLRENVPTSNTNSDDGRGGGDR